MRKIYLIIIFCICFMINGCGKTDRYSMENKDSVQIEKIDNQDDQGQVESENSVNKVVEKVEPETEMSEQDLLEAVYDRYYSQWSEDEMLAAIEERSQYRESCSFYVEVMKYMENIREVRDISIVVEPLYYTDMKYYKNQDFENVPPLIIYLAKNEIYARHGYIFRDENLNNYFNGQLWYEPCITSEDFNDSVFNEYEKTNLDLLADLDTYN